MTEENTATAIKTYLKTGDGSSLDALPQTAVIEYVTKKTRPLQKNHGSAEKDTAAAHRNQHEHVCKMLRDNAEGLSNRDVVEVMAVVDQDLRMGPARWNKNHTKIENVEKKTRETGATPMNARTGVTQSAVLERNLVRIDQIEMAFAVGEIGEKAAAWWLADFAKPLMSGNVSPLAAWKARTAQNEVPHKFRALVKETLEKNGGDVALNIKKAQLRNDKTIAATSAVVKRKQLIYKDDGTVDPECAAFKLGLVDKTGRPIEPKKATDAGLVHVEGHWRGDAWIQPHQRHKPQTSATSTKRAVDKPVLKPNPAPAKPTPKPTIVLVGAHTRSNGTKVAAHTRSAPTRASSSSRGGSGGKSVYVAAHTRSNGTKVAAHTRSAPSRGGKK